MHLHRKNLDSTHIYELIWSIPESFGGMTTAMLRRCKQLHDARVGASLSILTLVSGMDLNRVRNQLRDQWDIPEDVTIRNMWCDLRSMSDAELATWFSSNRERTPRIRPESAKKSTDVHLMDAFLDSENSIVSREHCRSDGSLLVSDDLIGEKGRRLRLYASDGKQLSEWKDSHELYLCWLAYVVKLRPAVVISEHRRIGEFLWRANMDGVAIAQVLHGAHLSRPQLGPFGPLLATRHQTLKNIEQFDLVAVLTSRQLDDLRQLGVDVSRTRVLPNSIQPSESNFDELFSRSSTSPERGVFVGRLSPIKRVDHILRAMNMARSHPSSPNVTLDVLGDGTEEETLRSLAVELGSPSSVHFAGHVDHAGSLLSEYSFLLFTSRSEGQGIVLLEALSQGCIPIAYDIRYGPSEVIRDGVNGYLVPDGDQDALAAAITKFVALPEAERSRMRKAAVESVRAFYSEVDLRRWVKALRGISSASSPREIPSAAVSAIADNVELRRDRARVSGVLRGERSALNTQHRLVAVSRNGRIFQRLNLHLEPKNLAETRFYADFSLMDGPAEHAHLLDFYVQAPGDIWSQKSRLIWDGPLPLRLDSSMGEFYMTSRGNLSFRRNRAK